MHYAFRVTVFAKPPHATCGRRVVVNGVACDALRGPDERPLAFDAFFPVSFEDAVAALVRLPRVDVEPDGFFVLAGGSGPTHWCVSGQLIDYGGKLHHVDLNGRCPDQAFDALLACFGLPAPALAFQLVEAGVDFDDVAFRAWASRAARGPGG
jgi:hypothetical protein